MINISQSKIIDRFIETRSRKRLYSELIGSDTELNENNVNENIDSIVSVLATEFNDQIQNKSSVPRILDGIFFSIVSNDNGNIVARCVNCYENRKGNLKSTGNFKSHYRLKHSNLIGKLEEYLKGKTEIDPKLQQPTLESFTQHEETNVI